MIKKQILILLSFVLAVTANCRDLNICNFLAIETDNIRLFDNKCFHSGIEKKDTSIQNTDSGSQQIVPTKDFRDAKRDVKFDLFGLFRGYSQLTYEVSTSAENSMELSLGIIGIGHNGMFEYSDTMNHTGDHNKSQLGLFFGVGYKMNKLPLFEIGGDSGVHLLQGLYARPMLYFGAYDENRIAYIGNNQYQLLRPTTKFASLQIELGKQWVIKNRAVFDMYFGLGYGIDNKKYYSTSYYDYITTSSFNYCNDRIGKSPGISFTIGIRTGLLLH